jgi:hypothetical protein
LRLLETHATREAAHHDGHWRVRASDHGFPVTDLWVNHDKSLPISQ